MFNCKEVSEKLSISMDESLPVHHRIMLNIHLLMCKYCNRFRKQLLVMRNALRFEKITEDEPGQPGSLSEATRERLKKAVKAVLP
jgi:hypothetical protein